MRTEIKLTIIFSVVLLAVIGAAVNGPIAQDPDYHKFADERTILSIPNFWNVVTNVPFVIVGAMGMLPLARGRGVVGGLGELRTIYFTFFLGVFATGIGSAFYHYEPANRTLVWDRVPITVSLMAFFSAVTGEHISINAGRKLVWPLIALGTFSVLYWYMSELRGTGDLRLYALVQYLPVLLTPVILLAYRSRLIPSCYLWSAVGSYGVAKIAESFDGQLYGAMKIISGHSIKHLAAALGAYIFYLALRRRRAV